MNPVQKRSSPSTSIEKISNKNQEKTNEGEASNSENKYLSDTDPPPPKKQKKSYEELITEENDSETIITQIEQQLSEGTLEKSNIHDARLFLKNHGKSSAVIRKLFSKFKSKIKTSDISENEKKIILNAVEDSVNICRTTGLLSVAKKQKLLDSDKIILNKLEKCTLNIFHINEIAKLTNKVKVETLNPLISKLKEKLIAENKNLKTQIELNFSLLKEQIAFMNKFKTNNVPLKEHLLLHSKLEKKSLSLIEALSIEEELSGLISKEKIQDYLIENLKSLYESNLSESEYTQLKNFLEQRNLIKKVTGIYSKTLYTKKENKELCEIEQQLLDGTLPEDKISEARMVLNKFNVHTNQIQKLFKKYKEITNQREDLSQDEKNKILNAILKSAIESANDKLNIKEDTLDKSMSSEDNTIYNNLVNCSIDIHSIESIATLTHKVNNLSFLVDKLKYKVYEDPTIKSETIKSKFDLLNSKINFMKTFKINEIPADKIIITYQKFKNGTLDTSNITSAKNDLKPFISSRTLINMVSNFIAIKSKQKISKKEHADLLEFISKNKIKKTFVFDVEEDDENKTNTSQDTEKLSQDPSSLCNKSPTDQMLLTKKEENLNIHPNVENQDTETQLDTCEEIEITEDHFTLLQQQTLMLCEQDPEVISSILNSGCFTQDEINFLTEEETDTHSTSELNDLEISNMENILETDFSDLINEDLSFEDMPELESD